MKTLAAIYPPHMQLLEDGHGLQLASCSSIARTLVRQAEESAKPNAERLREYRESNLESLRAELFSAAPIYDDLETVKLADSLSLFLADRRGRQRAGRKRCSAGKSPRDRAAELVRGTQAGRRRACASSWPRAAEGRSTPATTR